MNKKKIVLALAIASAVGITYAISVLKDLPEAFDWDLDDE
jgi:hypothetical protein